MGGDVTRSFLRRLESMWASAAHGWVPAFAGTKRRRTAYGAE
jgi:hypothetical protein